LPYQAALHQMEAALARDRIQAANARRQADRIKALLDKGNATPNENDDAQANAEALEAVVKADEATVATAKLNLKYCNIHSPVTGVAGRLLADVGNTVKSYDAALVVINQVQPISVSFSVPQDRLAEIRQYGSGQPLKVVVTIRGQKEPEEGSLTFIDNA